MPSNDRIDRLKKRLYRRGDFPEEAKRSRWTKVRKDVGTDWAADPEEPRSTLLPFLKVSTLKKFFIFSFLFLLVALGAAAYILFSEKNVITSDNIDISIRGPISISGGEELTLNVLIANKNAATLEDVDIIMQFPSGTRKAGAPEELNERYRNFVGDLGPGETHNETVKAVVFGTEGAEGIVGVIVQYRAEGSNAILAHEKVYNFSITSSPLDVVLALPEEVNVGNEMEIILDVSSNSEDNLSGILATLEYPGGFRFSSSSPKPSFGNNAWHLGVLTPGSDRTIRVRGILDGQNDEKKLFKTSVGVVSAEREDKVGVPYGSAFDVVSIRRPFVDLDLILSGNGSVSPSGRISGELRWANNLREKVLDGEITLKITGDALNLGRVLIFSGHFDSLARTISWSKRDIEDLGIIEPGSQERASFELEVLGESSLNTLLLTDPTISFEASFRGRRSLDGRPGDVVESNAEGEVRINSVMRFLARAVYSVGPLQNIGPWPPRVHQETSYTILWSLSNTTNVLEDVVVRAKLPAGVRHTGGISPSSANFSYDKGTGEIVWKPGNLSANRGGGPVAELAFGVAITPNQSQIDTRLPLVIDTEVSGVDTHTGTLLTSKVDKLDTRVVTDPAFTEGKAEVIP